MKTNIIKTISILLTVVMLFSSCAASQTEATTDSAASYEATFDPTLNFPEQDYPYVDFNTEEYNTIDENSFMSVQDNPLSTFSADVDTASYTNVRRMINQGSLPTPDAVRVEEMINYFSYDIPEPQNDQPFSVTTEMSPCPWNDDTEILSIALGTEYIPTDNLPPSNLVFLIDVSGSMSSENKLPLVQQAFSLLLDNLSPQDTVSIVTYAGSERVVIEGATLENKQQLQDAISDLESSGSTNGSTAIQKAYEIAQKHFKDDGNNRIILATDGDLNVGQTSESDLKNIVEKNRESGVFLSVLGFGDGNYKDNKMETLSQNGNGNYYYIDTKLEAQKVLANELGATLHTVAKDVKIQVEFNPNYINGYRLIGYENRLLDTRDFNDDTKDAGEIGAGHQMIALYEIVPADSNTQIESTDLRYQQTTTIDSDEIANIAIRYKQPDQNESILLEQAVTEQNFNSEMSENMKLMTSVAEFSMLLRSSPHIGSANYDDLMENIKALSRFTEDDYIIDFYTIVKKASTL